MSKLAALTCLTVCTPLTKRLRLFGAKVREALTPSADYWTWITRDGMAYEDVEVLFVRAKRVTFRHKSGTACLPISMLSEADRKHLERGYEGNGSLTMLPLAEATRSAAVESKVA